MGTNKRGPNVTPEQEAQLFAQMKYNGERMDAAYKSFSGSDVAEADRYRLARLFFVAVWEGEDAETALARLDAEWRAYAAQQADKVASAGKIKRGPRAGQSAIHHRWVSPDLFTHDMINLRWWHRKIMGGV